MIEIQFKTNSPYYEKEENGLKSNTVREVGEKDSRFDLLMSIIQGEEKGRIKINNPKTGSFFIRDITDVTYYGERFIISWKHTEDSYTNY